MKNRIFHLALSQAARRLGNPARLLVLAMRAGHHLRNLDARQFSLDVWRERLSLMGRMVSAYAHGTYRVIPAKGILSITAALIYFVNPLDVIPDALVGIGLTDDFAVATYVLNSLTTEINLFSAWEASQGSPTA